MQKPWTNKLAVILSVLAITTSPTAGELTVIYEQPGTRPITDFLEPRRAVGPERRTAPAKPSGVWDVRALLPIRSPGLTPGPVARRVLEIPVTQPLFLIGADDLSKAWLTRHRPRLEALGAVGMLVEAEDVADLEAIAELAGDLPIVPASGADIAQALGLAHYPVCIDGKRLWQ